MNRRAALRLLAGAVCLVGSAGCVHRLISDPDAYAAATKSITNSGPKPPKVSADHLVLSERVNELGRQIIDQNTFTGLDPIFHIIGVPETVIFHHGTAQVYLSEGLVRKCKTDAQLAAVLCSELGPMLAEKRAARDLGRDADTIREVATPGDGFGPAGAATEVGASGVRPAPGRVTPTDPAALARQLLRGAGFDPAELDKAEPLLKQSPRGDALRKQMAGSAPAPTWE